MPREAVRKLLWWSRITMFAAAAGLLGYCAFVLADTWNFQREANRKFDIARLHPAQPAGPGVAMGGMLGRIEIPRLGLSVAVAEGTAERTLRRAAGHIEGTKFPGVPGNVGIAGHRDTLFLPLKDIRQDDVIVLTTLQGQFQYRVVSTKIVNPSDVAVLDSDAHEILTLVTCHPFYFIGPAPNRFIVRAQRTT